MTSALISEEIQKLEPSAIIELFELDTSALGGDTYYFHAGTNSLSASITWNGQIYTRFPVDASGFELTANGQLPRPKLRVSNILGTITSLLLVYDDLLGSKVTRRRTLAKFLDAVNFPGGVNPTADTTAEFASDVFFIDRKASESREIIEFELAAAIDLQGVRLPRRQIIQNVCSWVYRSAECGYTGGPLFDANDQLLTDATTPEGVAFLSSYSSLQAAKQDLVTKQAALTAASQAKDASCEITLQETRFTPPGNQVQVLYKNFWTYYVYPYWGGSLVTLGTTYRMGALRHTVGSGGTISQRQYNIERWDVTPALCTPATSAYNSALTDRDAAVTALATAQSNYDTALAALPLDDPLWTRDVCGKRLSSNKLRFGEYNELPFGGFPASGLFG